MGECLLLAFVLQAFILMCLCACVHAHVCAWCACVRVYAAVSHFIFLLITVAMAAIYLALGK